MSGDFCESNAMRGPARAANPDQHSVAILAQVSRRHIMQAGALVTLLLTSVSYCTVLRVGTGVYGHGGQV